MNRLAITVSAITVATMAAILAAFGWVIWSELSAPGRDMATHLAPEIAAKLCVAFVLASLVAVAAIRWVANAYASPLKGLADDVRMIAVGNPQHKLNASGPAEVRALVADISVFAQRFEAVQRDVEAQIRESAAALEEERDTLAALTAKLALGVVICNLGGRVYFTTTKLRGCSKDRNVAVAAAT